MLSLKWLKTLLFYVNLIGLTLCAQLLHFNFKFERGGRFKGIVKLLLVEYVLNTKELSFNLRKLNEE